MELKLLGHAASVLPAAIPADKTVAILTLAHTSSSIYVKK